MYRLKSEASFDSAHFLKGYDGKCANIHGHRWRVVAEIGSETLIESGHLEGMIVDFGDLKSDLKALADAMDHTLIYQKGTLKPSTIVCLEEEGFSLYEVDTRPTAENMSKYFYDALSERGYCVLRVEVFETPNNSAVYEKREKSHV